MLNWHHQHKLYLKFIFEEQQANIIFFLQNAHVNIFRYLSQKQPKPKQHSL